MTDQSAPYDFIIAGAGCAGLSLAMQLRNSNVPFKKVLILDKEQKNTNDRTWCFWTKDNSHWYESVIFRQWTRFRFNSSEFGKEFNIEPYRYCMIRAQDFYAYCHEELGSDKRFEFKTEELQSIGTDKGKAFAKTSHGIYQSEWLFNSAFRNIALKKSDINFVQHFTGWLIETSKDVFDTDCPLFMDFNVPQKEDCRFVYVLPHHQRMAMIEYTGFSPAPISEKEYEEELREFIKKTYGCTQYTIHETETGIIPMYESSFINPHGERVMNIGTAGGHTKPSTGFTFIFIQQAVHELINSLERSSFSHWTFKRPSRFLYYDKILLDVMQRKKVSSESVFTALFRKNQVSSLLAFLNEESTFSQELAIMNSVPKIEFTRSALRKLF